MKDVPKIALPNDIKNVRFEDPVKTAEKIMRDEAGKTDIQIALTHEGVKNDINLAKNIEGLDLVIGGHDHVKPDEYCRDVGKTPVCQTPANGSYLGRIDLLVDRETHRVKVPQTNGKTMGWVDIDVQNKDVDIKYLNNSLIRIDSTLKDDAAVAKLIRGYSDPIKAEMNEVVGYATHEYKHGRDTTLPGSPLGILIANVIKNYGDADIGIMNSTGMRSNLPEGKITKGLIGKMLPFPNTVVTVKIKGADLKKLIQKEATTPLNLAGISSPDELNPEKIYKLAVISYLAYGGSGCTRLKKAPVIKADDKVIWDIFADYIKKEKKI